MKREERKNFNRRLYFIFVFPFLSVFFVLVYNLYQLQVVSGDFFREQADNQYINKVYHSFERGSIYFQGANKTHVLVAGQEQGYKLAVHPNSLTGEEKKFVVEKLSSLFPQEREKIFRLLNKKGDYFEVLHRLNSDEVDKIKDLLGKKALIYPEKWRTYPFHETAAQTIGFLGFDNHNDFGGRYGLENYYDDVLKRDNDVLYMNFFARALHGVKNFMSDDDEVEGDLYTSINIDDQIFLEKILHGVQDRWESEMSSGVILDLRTGDILAIASVPSFDNNSFSQYPLERFKNPLTSNVYEFGSVMKPLVMAIGIDGGYVQETTSYRDKGFVKVGEYTIRNFDEKGRGVVDMQDVLDQSLNTGMVFVSKKIPKERFREYFSRYGFGKKTGVDLPYEAKGLVKNLESNRDIEFANMSFGQGIAVSPLAFVKAFSSLANGGVPLTPHLGREIIFTSGVEKKLSFQKNERVLSEETAKRISKMLVHVFDHYNHGKWKFSHHSVAAKTGTAQIPAPDGTYYKGRHLHSFVGYFPAKKPRYLIFLYTVYPKGVKYSSQTLLAPFHDIVQYLISSKNIPPDR